MADEKHRLPGSSIEEFLKIVIAYSKSKGPATLDALSKIVATDTTTISRSNGFLKDAGIVEKKQLTPIGAKLARAFEHNQKDDIRAFLNELISADDFLSNIVTTIRLQKGMSEEELTKHILYASGQNDNANMRAGSRAVIELLKMAGLIREDGENFQVVSESQSPGESKASIEKNIPDEGGDGDSGGGDGRPPAKPDPSRQEDKELGIAINLQIQLPEFDDPKMYKELFVALRKHLIKGEE